MSADNSAAHGANFGVNVFKFESVHTTRPSTRPTTANTRVVCTEHLCRWAMLAKNTNLWSRAHGPSTRPVNTA